MTGSGVCLRVVFYETIADLREHLMLLGSDPDIGR